MFHQDVKLLFQGWLMKAKRWQNKWGEREMVALVCSVPSDLSKKLCTAKAVLTCDCPNLCCQMWGVAAKWRRSLSEWDSGHADLPYNLWEDWTESFWQYYTSAITSVWLWVDTVFWYSIYVWQCGLVVKWNFVVRLQMEEGVWDNIKHMGFCNIHWSECYLTKMNWSSAVKSDFMLRMCMWILFLVLDVIKHCNCSA